MVAPGPIDPRAPVRGDAYGRALCLRLCTRSRAGGTRVLTHLCTFDLPDRVAIYGGFAGDEKSRSNRSRESHRTVLSGGGGSWHVVTAGNGVAHTGVRATLDGLTIAMAMPRDQAGGARCAHICARCAGQWQPVKFVVRLLTVVLSRSG
jgi:hypothetical protein